MRKIDEAYEFIKNYIQEKEFPPTIREIADAINIKSTSTIAYYLRKLEENNKIVKGSYKNRSIQLMETIETKGANIITMPYVTNVTEGKSLMNSQNIADKYSISSAIFKGLDMFLIPIKDNSMKDSHIIRGDMVVVSRQSVAQNGEIVVAFVNGNYVVARLFREFRMFKLQPDNKLCDAIYLEKLTLLGKVVGVIRNQVE